MRLRLIATGLALLAGAPAAVADGPPPSLVASANLQGSYGVVGVITKAVGVPGEHRGQHVLRSWTFTSSCPAGPCPTVDLVRQRQGGLDHLVLNRVGPSSYSGVGAFYAPVRCHRRVYQRGALALFTIKVTITAATVQGQSVLATNFIAFYRNRGRLGLTRCFSAPAYDSASYLGGWLAATSIRRVARIRPSTAS